MRHVVGAAHLVFRKKTVVFIDIIGFGELVVSAASDEVGEESQRLAKAFEIIRNIEKFTGPDGVVISDVPGAEMDVKIFSDSVIISLEGSSEAALELLRILALVTIALMELGIWIRGGVAYDSVATHEGGIAGPGVNRAYIMESEIAVNPRIVFSKSFVNFLTSSDIDIDSLELVKRDPDGVYCVNAIEYLLGDPNDMPFNPVVIKDHLNRTLADIVDRPKEYSKVMNLAVRWNAAVNKNMRDFSDADYRTRDHSEFVDAFGAPLSFGEPTTKIT